MRLTILTITKAQPYALPFIAEMDDLAGILDAEFLIAADGPEAARTLDQYHDNITLVRSSGYLESVLDQAVARCRDGYILRLDDDERPDDDMLRWLYDRAYLEHDHWAFPRFNLWQDEQHYLTCMALYPDLQTRLSVKAKSGGRQRIHVGSPYGTGAIAPCHIEHHKFLIRSYDERWRTCVGYEQIAPGAGENFRQYSVPEDIRPEVLTVEEREQVAA